MAGFDVYSPAPASLPAGSGLAAAKGYFVKLSAGVLVPCSSQGERALGILGRNVSAAEAAAGTPGTPLCEPGSEVQVRVGTNGCTAWSEGCTDADGRAENASSADIVHIIFKQNGAVGDMVQAYIVSPYAKA